MYDPSTQQLGVQQIRQAVSSIVDMREQAPHRAVQTLAGTRTHHLLRTCAGCCWICKDSLDGVHSPLIIVCVV